MATLLEIREHLKSFYSKYDVYILPVLKFCLAFVALSLVNRNLGFMSRLDNTAIVLIVALLCSFLPANVIVVFAAVFCVLHVYALALECAVVVLVLFMLMFLLYFRFSPGDSLAVLLTPIFFMLKIPYAMPLAFGLLGTPLSAVSVGCGVFSYYVLDYIRLNSSVLGNLEAESTVQKFKYVVDNLILGNKMMVIIAAAFAVTIVLVFTIKMLSIDYSWTIALVIGAIADTVILLVGDMMFDLKLSVGGIVIGSIVSLLLMVILQFFVLSLDYSRTEKVQFEDDEYYYYVKAVPKMTVAVPEKKVKKITPRSAAAKADRSTEKRRSSAASQGVLKTSSRPVERRKAVNTDKVIPNAPKSQAVDRSSTRRNISGDGVEPEGWRKL